MVIKDNIIKLLFTDLDGTLLFNDKIHQKNLSIIKEILDKNIKVIIATGRGPSRVEEIYKKLNLSKLNLPTICFNGGLIYNFNNLDNKIIYSNTFSVFESEAIFRLAKVNHIKIWGYAKDCKTVFYNGKTILNRIIMKKYKLNNIKFSNDFSTEIFKFSFTGSKKNLLSFENAIKIKIDVNFFRHQLWRKNFLWEIVPVHSDKFIAIKKMIKSQNLTLNEIMAIGDGDNDFNMIKGVGLGVAMGNSVTHLKEVADYITDSFDNNGFVNAMKIYLLNSK